MKSSNLSAIAVLIFISILAKIFVLTIPFFVPHTGLDPYDYQYFFGAAQQVIHGIYPTEFVYPPLALIPMLIAYACSFGNQGLFGAIFQLLMILCDAVVIACIYMIGLKFLTRQQTFIAGLLYATSISIAYFSLTKFDSFPAALLMLAIYFTVCNETGKGYTASVIGLFTKIYPVIVFPFLYLYNREKFSKTMAIFLITISILGFVFHYQIISYIQSSLMRYFLAISTIITAIVYMLHRGKNNVRALLMCTGISILVTTLCMGFHSPQFYMWYAPIFCLLVADDIYATLAFCAVSVMVYLEFPVFYGVLYTNGQFVIPGAAWFFVLEWALMLLMVHLVTRKKIQINTKI